MGEPVDRNFWGELEPEEGTSCLKRFELLLTIKTEEEEEESEEESEEEEEQQPAPQDGMQTPSGMETPSGMTSVVSTVAGGLETPDFLELRKNAGRAQSEAVESGPRSLYQVVPEKQASVRGLMGSERGYDVSAVTGGGAIPVLGDERGSKVSVLLQLYRATTKLTRSQIAQRERRGSFYRCRGTGRHVGRRAAAEVRATFSWLCWCSRCKRPRRLLGYDREGDIKETTEGAGEGEQKGEGIQVLICCMFGVCSLVLCMSMFPSFYCISVQRASRPNAAMVYAVVSFRAIRVPFSQRVITHISFRFEIRIQRGRRAVILHVVFTSALAPSYAFCPTCQMHGGGPSVRRL